MQFQPGQSGNPAGRPPGARNKKTIAMEQELAEQAQKAVRDIINWAGRGNAVAMRICAEWVRPTGTNRSPGLELPPITCADDAQAALQTVLEGFASGAISVRELPVVLAGVERAVRILDRIAQVRERERAGRQIRGELHPGMVPKPSGKPDPLVEALRAAGEEVPDYLAAADAVSRAAAEAEGLYSPVNSDEERSAALAPEASSQAAAMAENLYSPVNSSAEAAAATEPEGAHVTNETAGDGLYFPVNSRAEPPPEATDAAPPFPEVDVVVEHVDPALGGAAGGNHFGDLLGARHAGLEGGGAWRPS